MKPPFGSEERRGQARIYVDGEDERCAPHRSCWKEGIALPILIGRPHVVDVRPGATG
jgi:hypothetical protein